MSFIGRIQSLGRTAGFYEGMTKNIEKREEYIRDRVERARQRAEQNATKISQRKLRADTALMYANQLKEVGVPEDLIKSIVQSGPDAVKKAAEDLIAYTQERGISSISPEEARQYISVGEDFAGSEKDLQELILDVYGANVQPAARVEGGKQNLLQQLFKFDTEAEIDREISRPEYGNLSVADINRLAAQAEYTGDPAAAAMVRLPSAPRDDTMQFSEYFRSISDARKQGEEVQSATDTTDPKQPFIPNMYERERARIFYENPSISDRLKQQIEISWGLQNEEIVNYNGSPHRATLDEEGNYLYLVDMQGNYIIFNGVDFRPPAGVGNDGLPRNGGNVTPLSSPSESPINMDDIVGTP